ncbi:merozoite surface protein 7 (MSP7) [Plasmodium vivax North Korean]|uniref:Merozoite surface protein 7 (MSP7) n=1 Tax=Plasmodium vivax North Korean TaxID=1035514 RepID=A0A0J9TRM3_PLAVI|nr:merozoite surface protein 7 (MSP7) [Plasmodium vivax North Korean]
MRKKIVFVCSIFVLLSCSPASSEQLGIQKKKKNLEQDAMHALMKKLESLYKLSATDNGEIFNKEIDALKKQIDQLHQHGGGNEGESLGHLLESEAADDSGKKTIFGVDEDDLDNYDADFIGQSKGKIKGQADTTAVAKPPAHSGAGAHGSYSPPKPSVLVVPGKSGKEDSVTTLETGYESIHGEDEPREDSTSHDSPPALPKGTPLRQEGAQRANNQILLLHEEVKHQAEEAEETKQIRPNLLEVNNRPLQQDLYKHPMQEIHNYPMQEEIHNRPMNQDIHNRSLQQKIHNRPLQPQ